jgi:hypothetical protein
VRKTKVVQHLLILLTGMLVCGLIAILFGKELQWDLVSYHYYNPFAFLHHRWGFDYWPATYLQMYFNPFVDILTYILIKYFQPIYAVFLLGAIHGINFWLMFCISYLIVSSCQEVHRTPIAIMLAVIGIFSPIAFSELGSFMGENFISLFGLGAILLQIYCLNKYSTMGMVPFPLILLSGLVLGIGIGFKLTLIYVAMGFVTAYCFVALSFEIKAKIIAVCCLGLLVGFLLSYGYWMMFLWTHYHNPFYPLYNGFFKAPGFHFYNWHDDRFFPRHILQTIFYPFYFSKNGFMVCDLFTRDYRLLIIYILLFVNAVVLFWRKVIKKTESKINVMHQWTILFFIFSYIAWQTLFSNIRYFSSLQIMASVIIYLLLYYWIKNSFVRNSALMVILYFILMSMTHLSQERLVVYSKDYFNVQLPSFVKQEKSALVLTVTPHFSNFTEGLLQTGVQSAISDKSKKTYLAILQTYLIPSFPPGWRFVGVITMQHEYLISDVAKKLIENNNNFIYLLTAAYNMPSFMKLAASLGFSEKGQCGAVLSDRLVVSDTFGSVLLCQMRK